MLRKLGTHTAGRIFAALLIPTLAMPTFATPAAAAGTGPTVADLQALHPGLPLHQVTPDEFRALTHSPYVLAQAVTTEPSEAPHIIKGSLAPLGTLPEPASTNRPATNTPLPRASSSGRTSSVDSGFHGSLNIDGISNVDSTEAAIVVFVLAGTIVIASAVIYGGMLLANIAMRPDDVEVWSEIDARAQFFSGASQQGFMSGGALALGLEDGDSDVGVVLEGGYLDANVVTIENKEVSVAGAYFMAGPVVRFWFDGFGNGPAFETELLAGTAANYDLISRASFALNWTVTGHWRAGLRFGALYLDVAETEGPIYKAGDDFNLLGGIETSVRF